MLSAIKGTYKNGQVILDETPETDGPAAVIVTFTGDISADETIKKPVFGFAKGTVLYMAPDFNEPLEDLKDYM